jgi:hypothetical protein
VRLQALSRRVLRLHRARVAVHLHHPGAGSTQTDAGSTPADAGSTPTDAGTPPPPAKSAKRGIAFDLATPADLAAVSPGVSWWYNWSPQPHRDVPTDFRARYGMDFIPMLWNGDFNAASIESILKANPHIQYLLLLNEPNLTDQANMSPQDAARLWPRYESVAANTGVKLVGPAMSWGTLQG